MAEMSNLVLIGAAGRNAGKTELACRLLQRFSVSNKLVAVKVTSVDEREGPCPRGGAGCGACSSLCGSFEIREELDPAGGKDTSRLLAAGASQVFWLLARRSALAEGFAALRQRLPAGVPVICESNSLRLVVVPDLFVIVRSGPDAPYKPTAAAVRELADLTGTLGSDGPLAMDRFSLGPDGFAYRFGASAIVLAGGRSRRMGRDKGLLELDGEPLVQRTVRRLRPWFDELLVSSREPGHHPIPGTVEVVDPEPGQGPLMGIASGLERSTSELNFVVACDIPNLQPALMRRLFRAAADFDAVVPESSPGRIEPVFALYRKSALPALHATLAGSERRIRHALDRLKVNYLPMPEAAHLADLNTPEDLERFLLNR